MTLEQINRLPPDAFVARYGALFECSPWVVERAAGLRPFEDLHTGLMSAVAAASREDQLRLIHAHPELASKAAIARMLTEDSQAEQASAGLDRLTLEEFERFHALNSAYRERFGFPFIICVRRTNKAGILAAMQSRLNASPEAEIQTAIREIGEIVRLRLEAMA
jgi:2-oxo-4-hydroxy-4-carboxy-5-ureidoimidazoline decarboxylase